jgi:hypothetical protein
MIYRYYNLHTSSNLTSALLTVLEVPLTFNWNHKVWFYFEKKNKKLQGIQNIPRLDQNLKKDHCSVNLSIKAYLMG